jgi:hypothetical protein
VNSNRLNPFRIAYEHRDLFRLLEYLFLCPRFEFLAKDFGIVADIGRQGFRIDKKILDVDVG